MTSNRGITMILAVVVGMAIATTMSTTSQADHHEAHEDGKAADGQTMPRPHHPIHEPMRQKMRAHDERLEELVAAMNAADGAAKIDAMAAVLNELMAQRRSMRAHHDEMRAKRGHKAHGEGRGEKRHGGKEKPEK